MTALRMFTRLHRSTAIVLLIAATRPAPAQCVGWDERFHSNGITNSVSAQAIYDDGGGPALYYGGPFVAAGSTLAEQIVKWDGASWSTLGGGVDRVGQFDAVYTLAVFDEGAGELLFVGGEFSSVDDGLPASSLARWDGASWSALPLELSAGARVYDLEVWDDGGGPALFVAGRFTSAGGVAVNHVAKWDGASWSALAGGVSSGSSTFVFTLEVFDDGSGAALFAGGSFLAAGGTAVSHLAKWNGTTWSDVGGGCDSTVLELGVWDDGGGAELYLSGFFTQAGGVAANTLAKWDGASFSSLGSGTPQNYYVQDFEVYDDGSGPVLYAGGRFPSISGVQAKHIARWDGASWSALPQSPDEAVGSLLVWDDGAGAGPRLFAAGAWQSIGTLDLRSPAIWDGAQWSSVGSGGLGFSGFSFSAQTFAYDDGGGPQILYSHSAAGTTSLQRFDGSAWSSWTTLDGSADAYALHDDGVNGEQLYLGGQFATIGGTSASSIARWTGSTWAPLGSGLTGGDRRVTDMRSFDDGGGPALWVTGQFNAAGLVQTRRVARWNGASWSEPGGGVSGSIAGANGGASFAVFDEGLGPRLFLGGAFTSAGPAAISCIARWDGASWTNVGAGLNGPVSDLAVFDDGSGEALYAVGAFTLAGSTPVSRVARWDGASWSDVGGGTNGTLTNAEIFDDGSGPQLYVAGNYLLTSAGGVPVLAIARWNGAIWSDVAGGIQGYVSALDVHDDPLGFGPSLWVAGSFWRTGTVAASNFARYGRTWPCATIYCTAGTSANGCAPAMSATGSPSASFATPFVVSASNVEGQKLGLIFYGLSGATASPWGTTSSLLCVKPPQQRMAQSSSAGTSGACDGWLSADWNAYHASHPTALGSPFAAGATVWLQGWYRDPPSSKTTALTDALEAIVGP